MLRVLLPCFPLPKPTTAFPSEKAHHYTILAEEPTSSPVKHAAYPTLTTQESASSIVSAFQNAKEAGPSLDATIQSLVHQAGGWSEYLAAAIVSALITTLEAGSEMSAPMREAYDKACDAAKVIEGFAAEHPILTTVFCTVVAMGILAILAPYVLGALGFAELGPIEGMF